MRQRTDFTVLAFDVTDDRRRRRIVRLLESWGERAQKSVFEAWTTEQDRKKIDRQARRIINADEDRFAIYVLPPADHKDIISLGSQPAPVEDLHYLIC